MRSHQKRPWRRKRIALRPSGFLGRALGLQRPQILKGSNSRWKGKNLNDKSSNDKIETKAKAKTRKIAFKSLWKRANVKQDHIGFSKP